MHKTNNNIETRQSTIQLIRQRALTWWNNINLEEQFYKTIKHNELIEGYKTRHPHTLTSREIEIIYNAEHVAYRSAVWQVADLKALTYQISSNLIKSRNDR